MGLLDDTASLISGRSSHSKRHHKSSKRSKSGSRSRSRSRTRHHSHSHSAAAAGAGLGLSGIAASIFGGGDDGGHGHGHGHRDRGGSDSDSSGHKHRKHKSSSSRGASFFGLGGGGNASRSSFFSGFGAGGARSPSYYKRSPRPNFVSRVLRRLKRLLRDLVYYAKRHPLKVFMLVIMPLITGGALTALLARFGLRLPGVVEKMLGVATKAATGDSIGLVGEAVRMASGGLGGGGSGGGGFNHAHASIERGRDGGMQWERRSVERDGYGRGAGGWGDGFKGIAKMFT
ncbi:hypothetical protein B0T24DRAFT_27397 [Lasiosphaeria ovina]|uniref:Uncharacterized protein n=1 Tax=Lasiosphaeria ovina TaxID=92902 RepID=A0AAE0NJW3_9PEZI|nr:hypothetical protein B0T24DRAFT_27397 [Lasiosphaeria ovina]